MRFDQPLRRAEFGGSYMSFGGCAHVVCAHLLSLVVLDSLSVCSSPKVLNSSPLAAETYGVGISCGETGQGRSFPEKQSAGGMRAAAAAKSGSTACLLESCFGNWNTSE